MELRVVFYYEGMDKDTFFERALKKGMEAELTKFYNEYAEKSNEVIENWNNEFNELNPTYFEDNKGKDIWDLIDYNDFIRNKEKQLIKELKFNERAKLMNFDIGEELNLFGSLKLDPSKKIQFFLKEA